MKFVLRLECEEEIGCLARSRALVHQGYLSGGKVRVRMSEAEEDIQYYLTFKHNNGDRVIEIEKKIDRRDYLDLWEDSMNRLVKVRYKVKDSLRHCWEIDFFKDHHNHTYFAMAEHEMPEGMIYPDVIPLFISSNLLYGVPLTDTRFASKVLADVRYAKHMYQSLFKEHCHEDEKQVV